MANKIKLNNQQQEFVNTDGVNVLVSASAGSGKTSTMIAKVSNLIQSGEDINNILILTFTEAAASEMKEKLHNELMKSAIFFEDQKQSENVLEQENAVAKLNKIYDAIDNLAFADIGTFHAVFKKIISKYFYHLELDPVFGLIDDHEQKILLSQSVDDAFKKFVVKKDKEFFELSEMFNKKRQSTAFKDLITSVYYTSQEKPNYNEWFKQSLEQNYTTDFENNKSVQYVVNHYKSELQNYKEQLQGCLNLSVEYEWAVQTEIFNSHLSYINAIIGAQSFEEFLKLCFEINFDTFRRPGNLDGLAEEDYEKVKSQRDEFKKFVQNDLQKKLETNNIEDIKTAFNENKRQIQKLNEIMELITKTYNDKKQKKSQLDFNDLQKYMLKLIEIPEVLQEIKSSYNYIFVDEFQDVNEIQHTIVSAIAGTKNLFMIGDVKQSIYEFRLASPAIFINKYNEYSRAGSDNKVIKFNENYRSSKNILEFANHIFGKLITTDTIEIDYKTTSQLVAGNKDLVEFDNYLKQNNKQNVSLKIINTHKTEDKDDDEEQSSEETDEVEQLEDEEQKVDQELSGAELEAEAVVEEILSLIGKEYLNSKTQQIERLDFKDIAVLTRDNKEFVSVLQSVLQKHKISSFISVKNNIFKTYEVIVVNALLKLLDNEIDDYSLATFMLSPFIAFSYNDLAKIRITQNDRNVAFYNCVKEYENYADLNKADNVKLLAKINDFFEVINHYRKQLVNNSVHDVLWQFINDYSVLQYFKSMPDGATKESNILQYLSQSQSENFKYNTTVLVKYFEELSQKDNFTTDFVGQSNSVTLLTMHKSKGLEFPAVILAELGKQFSKNSTRGDIVYSQNLSIAIKNKNIERRTKHQTLQLTANVLEKHSTNIKEQIRLLYVATTRAKNYLTMVGRFNVSGYEKLLRTSPLQTKSFLELLLLGLSDKRGQIQNLFEKSAEDSGKKFAHNMVSENNTPFSFEVLGEKTIMPKTFEDTVLNLNNNAPLNTDLFEQISNNFNFVYDSQKSVAVKSSVSSLLQEEDYVYSNEASKQLKTNEQYATNTLGTEIGNAYHKVMAMLNYTESFDEVCNIVNAVLEMPKFANVKKFVDSKKVYVAAQAVLQLINNQNFTIFKERAFIMSDEHKKLVAGSDVGQKIIVQGVVDLMLVGKDQVLIVDFKTNKGMTEQDFEKTYGLQLSLYAKAVEYAFNNLPVKKLIYSFELGKMIEIT